MFPVNFLHFLHSKPGLLCPPGLRFSGTSLVSESTCLATWEEGPMFCSSYRSLWKPLCRDGRQERLLPLLRTVGGVDIRRNWGCDRENERTVVCYRDPEATAMIMGQKPEVFLHVLGTYSPSHPISGNLCNT